MTASIFTPVKFKDNPSDLVGLIAALGLWNDPRYSRAHQEIAIVSGMWSGVLNTPRPQVTLFVAENGAHSPITGTIVLIDDTYADAPPDSIDLRLEGYPCHDFNPNVRWAPIFTKTYTTHDVRSIMDELKQDISSHFSNTPWSSRREMGNG